jgi:hypothetical protein
LRIGVEAPGRVELPTNGLGNRCSIHLSYGARLRYPVILLRDFILNCGCVPRIQTRT